MEKVESKTESLVLIDKLMKFERSEDLLQDIFTLILNGNKSGEISQEAGYELMAWVRREAKKIPSAKMYELMHKTYIWGGQNSFDQFMIACEWYREPKARFWLPRRSVLEGQHGIATKIQNFIDDTDGLYLGFSMPPGTGKSTLIKFLLAYIASKFPDSANMYVSYADGMVKMVYDSVKAILTDTVEYRTNDIFVGNGKPKISAENYTISYRKDGDFPTIGFGTIGGSITGKTRANKFLITDDLVKNAEMARSPSRLENLYSDYKSTIMTRTIGESVKQIQLGTIWSKYDPISRMKDDHEDDPRYVFITIPVCDDEGHSNFLYDHPDRYTDETIARLREDLDNVTFSCLYLQRGIDKEGIALPREELNWYMNDTLPSDEADNIAFSCDVAWGGGDSLAMPIAYVFGEEVYIHDVVFDKGNKEITKPRVAGKIMQHKCRMGRFEANNGGDEYAADISSKLRDYHYSCMITHKKAPSTMAKVSKIEQYSPDIKKFYFNREKYKTNKEYRKFVDEATSFSFSAKNLHDDAIDSLAQLAEYLIGKKRVATVGKRPF